MHVDSILSFSKVTTRFGFIQTCTAKNLNHTLQIVRPELDEFYERHIKGDQGLLSVTKESFCENHLMKHKKLNRLTLLNSNEKMKKFDDSVKF